MITQNYDSMNKKVDEGCYIINNTEEECAVELEKYCKEHLKKYLYIYSFKDNSKTIVEVLAYDKKPVNAPLLCTLVQEGSEGLQEIDFLSDEEKANLNQKKLNLFAFLGHQFLERK